MFIYWLLFAFPAAMALAYPVRLQRTGPSSAHGPAQGLAFLSFVVFYVLLGALRFQTGGDWDTYDDTFNDIKVDTIAYAMTRTDPLYGVLNWLSAKADTGIYAVNGICCGLLGYGTVAAAIRLREPWLAVLIAVPYLLIVVGLGYVRQGAAIGLILIAIANLDRSRPLRTIGFLVLATGFHSAAALALPVFAWALVKRNKVLAVFGTLVAAAIFVFVLAPRIGTFEQGYVEAEYDSGGATVRVMMGLLPSLLILARWRSFAASPRVRSVWLLMALANVGALVGLVLSPSSTAVDRIALFFSVIQLAAFGEFRGLVGISERMVLITRLALIGVAAAVQMVWLVFGTHAVYWVPYKSVLQFL